MDEESKAVQEVAKTTGKAIDAAEKLGGFFTKICGGALVELGLSARDWSKYFRYTQLLKIKDKVDEIHRVRRIEGKTIPIDMRYAFPLIDQASLETDESIQTLWARLIANATDPERRFQIKKIHIQILSSLEPLDVLIITYLSRKGWNLIIGETPTGINSERLAQDLTVRLCDIEISLLNLLRLGCIEGARPIYLGDHAKAGINSDKEMVYRPSFLGYSLLEACKE